MVKYKFKIDNQVHDKITSFYHNIYLHKKERFCKAHIRNLIKSRYNSIRSINENTILMRPYLNSWKDYNRVLLGEWNFAVKKSGNMIHVVDACHRQNLTNNPEIRDNGQLPYHNPRITSIHFPTRLPGGSCFIRADIDGEWQGIRKISEEDYDRGRLHPEYAIHLAERAYAKELAQERLPLDEFLYKGRKP